MDTGIGVRRHLRYVERFSEEAAYQVLTHKNTRQLAEVAPLLPPSTDEATAVQFDSLMYGIELAWLVGKKYAKARKDLRKKVRAVADVANIPAIQRRKEFLRRLLRTDCIEIAGISECEHIRRELRDLIKYIPPMDRIFYNTDPADEIVSSQWHDPEPESGDPANYKLKVNYYIRRHRDEPVIVKLHGNQPLMEPDVKRLEDILWSEAGTKADYEKEYGGKPLGELVREIVGLDINAARAAFSKYLNDAGLDRRQIYFVDQIVSYIAKNGMMKDLSVLRGAPFTDHGSVAEIFTDLSVWLGIRQVIDGINANAASSFEQKSCGANRSTALLCAGGAGIQTAPPE